MLYLLTYTETIQQSASENINFSLIFVLLKYFPKLICQSTRTNDRKKRKKNGMKLHIIYKLRIAREIENMIKSSCSFFQLT